MGNLKEKALKESQKIVENLIVQTPQGKTFQFESFIQGLSEEIEDFWVSGVGEGLVCFHLVESGDLVYGGLTNHSLSVQGPTNIEVTFALREDANLGDVSEEQLDVFTLLSSMKEAHCKEKSKILESLDQISIDFDKKLIEAIKQAKTAKKPDTTKIAEEYLQLDISTKKQKLLEKLLEGK
jgi:hypothetical protein